MKEDEVQVSKNERVVIYPRRKWIDEERDFLKRVYMNPKYTVDEIAEALNRSVSSITVQAKSLGLSRKNLLRVVAKEGYKICGSCKKELLLENFNKNKTRVDGYDWQCKHCKRERSRKINKEQ